MHRLLALLAVLTTSLTPVAALHCELAAAPATAAAAARAHAGHAHAGHAHIGQAHTGQAQHHAAPAPGHAPGAPAGGAPAVGDRPEHAAPNAPDPHPDCRLVMACGMSMLRSTEPTTARAPLPEAGRPERATALALTVAPAPADPPPPRRPF